MESVLVGDDENPFDCIFFFLQFVYTALTDPSKWASATAIDKQDELTALEVENKRLRVILSQTAIELNKTRTEFDDYQAAIVCMLFLFY